MEACIIPDVSILDDRAHRFFLQILKDRFNDKPRLLAKAIGVPASYVSDWKGGKHRRLTIEHIEQISKIVGIDPAAFFIAPGTPYIAEVHEMKAVSKIRVATELGVLSQVEAVTDAVLKVAEKEGQIADEETKKLDKNLAELRKRHKKKTED